jgi:WD40 repeat protein
MFDKSFVLPVLPLLAAVSLLPAVGPSVDAEAPLPAGAFARLGTSRLKHTRVTSGLAFTPDGKTVVTASHAGTVRFWDTSTGRETRQLVSIGHHLALSPDGKTLATVSWGPQIVLRDTATGKPTASLQGHTAEVVCLAFSPDGKSLLSASRDRTLRMWDVAAGKTLWSATAGGEMRWAAFSRDGKRVAAGGEDTRVYLWDAAGGGKKTFAGHTARVLCVAFTPDGNTLVSGSWDTYARLWDVNTGKQTRAIKHQGGVEAVAVSPDGKSLAVLGGYDHTLYLWDLTSLKDKLLWKGRQMHGLRLAFSRDGTMLASTGWDNTVRLWEVASGRRIPADLPPGHEGWVYAVAALPDGQGLVSAGSDGQVLLWDAERRAITRSFRGHTNRVWCLAVAPDGRTVASGASDQTIRIWELSSGKVIRKIPVRGPVKGLAFSPDGRRLASAIGEDRYSTWMGPIPGASAQVWDPATGELKLTLAGHDGGVKAVAFAPSGKALATAGNDGSVRLWDTATGALLRRQNPGATPLEAVAFSPDGEVFAAVGQDQKVRLWQTESGELLFNIDAPKGWGLGLAFSPDGRTLVTSSEQDVQGFNAGAAVQGHPVRLWEVATGLERARFEGHQGTAHAAAFLADGTALVSGGADGCVLLWDLTGRRLGTKPLPPDTAWAGLLSEDGAEAHRSVWALVAQPGQALPRLRAALKPALRVDPARLAKLVKDLDDDAFAVRERATEELEEIGEPAAKALRDAAKDGTAEVRTRANRLLEKLAGKGEGLRQRRAMEVLEHVRHPEADALLKALAGGDPESRTTKEAKASLQRRAKRAER